MRVCISAWLYAAYMLVECVTFEREMWVRCNELLQCSVTAYLKYLTHKFNLVKLLTVTIIENEGSGFLEKFSDTLRQWAALPCK